ncbi:sensor histidine kinase [Salicola sp. Rm-C-2C1-2]|uniref:sensor histidine kinase n=1 Tax=Salicola sp. Rm-C-2C1-2 TaxID=3141321 RepID=UPI0032E3E2FE
MIRPALMIRHQINLGFALVLIMALLTIFAVIEWQIKPNLIEQQKKQITINQKGLRDLLDAKLGQIELLTSTMAQTAAKLPKNEALFKKTFPPILDNHGDPTIAGGGIWPEPNAFEKGVTRRSFFWGRSEQGLEYVDDYNDPEGSGYHTKAWYKAGEGAPADRCAWSEAYIDPFTRTPMVTCTIPIREGGRFAGVATVDMRLEGISDILTRYGEENDGYAFAIDSSGHVVSSPKAALPRGQRAPSLMTVDQMARKLPWLRNTLEAAKDLEDATLVEIKRDGVFGEAAYADLIKHQQTGWVIGLAVPQSRMTAAADSMGLFLMAAIGALLLGVGVVAAVIARNLLHKVQQTTHQIRELVDGETTEALHVGTINEVGELRQAVNAYGDKLKSLLQHLEDVKDELVQSEKLSSLGSLVSGIAHELNTPIGNAKMASTAITDANRSFSRKLEQNITRRDLDEFMADVDEGAQIIERNMTRASELIGAFKQLAVDQASSHRREFDLEALMNEVSLSLRPTLQRSPYQLETNIPKAVTLDSFPGSLSQVLINLINNALLHAFAGRNEGCISIRASTDTEGQSVTLQVADDGNGIPVDRQKSIFDPFYTTRLGQGGSGLGLHITFNLVTGILGGHIEVQGAPDQGSCFIVTIPLIAPTLTESS